jgi:hypothetical protein
MKTKEDALIPEKKDEESRREFLIKAGKMALYIPPAMMVLMHPSRNAVACNKSYNPPPPQCSTNEYQLKSFTSYSGFYSGSGGSGGSHHRRRH